MFVFCGQTVYIKQLDREITVSISFQSTITVDIETKNEQSNVANIVILVVVFASLYVVFILAQIFEEIVESELTLMNYFELLRHECCHACMHALQCR